MRFRNQKQPVFSKDESRRPDDRGNSIRSTAEYHVFKRGWVGDFLNEKWRFIAGTRICKWWIYVHVCSPQGKTGKADIMSAAESLKSRMTALGTVMWPWGPPRMWSFFLTFTGSPWQYGMVYENLMNSGEITMGKTHPLPLKSLRQAAIDDLHRIYT